MLSHACQSWTDLMGVEKKNLLIFFFFEKATFLKNNSDNLRFLKWKSQLSCNQPFFAIVNRSIEHMHENYQIESNFTRSQYHGYLTHVCVCKWEWVNLFRSHKLALQVNSFESENTRLKKKEFKSYEIIEGGKNLPARMSGDREWVHRT